MGLNKLLVGAAVVCAAVSVAEATTTKIKAFHAIHSGMGSCSSVDGMAIIKIDYDQFGSPTSTVHVHMQDLPANDIFGVGIMATDSGDFDHSFPFDLVTNPAGNGSVDIVLPTVDLGAHPIVYIYSWDGASDYTSRLGFDEDQFLAEGTVPN